MATTTHRHHSIEAFDPTSRLDPSILIIAAEEPDATALRRELENNGFGRITVVTDPGLGLAYARQYGPELVIVDTHLPRRDTLVLLGMLRRLRTHDDRWPILALSRHLSPSAHRSVRVMGANDFIAGPFDDDRVIRSVRSLLDVQRSVAELEDPMYAAAGDESLLEGVVRQIRGF
jgi:DNA-binding response OmpR family regulator